MISNLLNDIIIPYYLVPFDMILRILFDRMLSASIIMSIFYTIIVVAHCLFNNKITPYMRYYMWLIMLSGLFLSRSTLLPMVIFNPIYAVITHIFGNYYNNLLHSIFSILWISIVLVKICAHLKNRAYFTRSLETYPKLQSCIAFNMAYSASGISKRINLLASNKVNSPASFGIMKKYIILPQNYEERYTETELYALFLHELTHIKQKDTSKNFILEIFSIVFWFNPITDKMIQTYKDDCEVMCDLAVLSNHSVDAMDYGKLLIKELNNKNHIRYVTGLNSGFIYVRDRLLAIRNFSDAKKTRRQKIISMMTMVFFSFVIYVSLFSICPDVPINNILVVINYDDGTCDKIELSNDNPNISLLSDKVIICNDYFTNLLAKGKNIQRVEFLEIDISIGLFAEYCRTKNFYYTDDNILMAMSNSTIIFPSKYNNEHKTLQNIYSYLIRSL